MEDSRRFQQMLAAARWQGARGWQDSEFRETRSAPSPWTMFTAKVLSCRAGPLTGEPGPQTSARKAETAAGVTLMDSGAARARERD